MVFVEILLCHIIIKKVAYTEIDWIAYMQEVKGFLDGERNYKLISGDTGPLVYPAGFVYVFSALFNITDSGKNLVLGNLVSLPIVPFIKMLNAFCFRPVHLSSGLRRKSHFCFDFVFFVN